MLVGFGACIVAIITFAILNLLKDNGTFETGVGNDLTERLFDSAFNDFDTCGFIVVVAYKTFESLDTTDVANTSTGNDTLGDSGASCRKCVINAVFLLFHLNLRGSTDVENGNTTCELGKTLLEFLAVVIALGCSDLVLDLSNTLGNTFFVACAIHDCSVLLVNGNLFGCTKEVDSCAFEFKALFFRNYHTTSEDCDIFEHFFAAVAKTGGFNGAHFQRTAETVDNESCESLAIYILGNDEERTTGLSSSFENREHIFENRNLLVEKEDERVVHVALHLLGVGYEIGRNVTAVELHTFYNINTCVGAFGFFNSDYALFFNLAHSLGNKLTDFGIIVGRDAGNILDFAHIVVNFMSLSLDRLNHTSDSLVDTALEVHRIGTGSYVLETGVDDSLSENSSGCCAITGIVTCL